MVRPRSVQYLDTSVLKLLQSSLIWAIVAIFFPPLPVAIRTGCSGHFILNIILLLLAWIPAVLHAWWVILEYDSHSQKKADKRMKRAQNEDRVGALKQAESEKPPVEMGNQQGWYAQPPPPPPQQQQQGQIQIQSAPPTYSHEQHAPEHAMDVKREPLQPQAAEHPRDVKQ